MLIALYTFYRTCATSKIKYYISNVKVDYSLIRIIVKIRRQENYIDV